MTLSSPFKSEALLRLVDEERQRNRAMRRPCGPRPATERPLRLQPEPQGLDLDKLRELMKSGGAAAVKARLLDERDRVDSDQFAFQMLQAGKAAADAGDSHGDFELAQTALTLSRSEKVLRGFFWAAQRAHRFEHACQAIRDLERLYGTSQNPTNSRCWTSCERRQPINWPHWSGSSTSRPSPLSAFPAASVMSCTTACRIHRAATQRELKVSRGA